MNELEIKYRHYAARLDAAMRARKLTNEGMGERINAHAVTVSKLRNNSISLDDEWRAKTAAGLQLPEEILFGSDPLPQPRPYEIYVSPKKAAKARTQRTKAERPTIALYGLAAGSLQGHHTMTGDPVDEVPCPPALRNVLGAYALRTRGQSMAPRFVDGSRLYINPHQKVRAGDDVIIQVRNHESAGTDTWVKRYDGEDAEHIYVSQFNPPARIAFKKQYVMHVHRVVPLEELFD